MPATTPRKRAIAPESLPEVLAQAVQAAKARAPKAGARRGVTGLPLTARQEIVAPDSE